MAIPNEVFKYTQADSYAFDMLQYGNLYFSDPAGFNDPFDCTTLPKFKNKTKQEKTRIMKQLSHSGHFKELNEYNPLWHRDTRYYPRIEEAWPVILSPIQNNESNIRVCCFSSTRSSCLMWSHYSNKHQGICVGFKTGTHPLHKLSQVVYSKKIPNIDLAKVAQKDKQEITKMLFTKSIDWKYEKEFRAIVQRPLNPQTSKPIVGGTLIPFSGESLVSLTFGVKFNETNRPQYTQIAKALNPQVAIYQSRIKEDAFELIFDRID